MTTHAHQEKKRLENPPSAVKIRIQRREKEGAAAHWETFEISYRRNLNVISALMDIRKNPVTIEGKTDNAAGLGYELFRTGMRYLHNGH